MGSLGIYIILRGVDRMKKIFKSTLVIAVLMLSLSASMVSAESPSISKAETYQNSDEGGIGQGPILLYKKTITKKYSSTNFPETVTYSEYNNEYKAWYEGELRFISAKGHEATYSGWIYRQKK